MNTLNYDDENFYELREFAENDVDDDSKLYYFISDLGIDIKPDENGITMVKLQKVFFGGGGRVIGAVDQYLLEMSS